MQSNVIIKDLHAVSGWDSCEDCAAEVCTISVSTNWVWDNGRKEATVLRRITWSATCRLTFSPFKISLADIDFCAK
ncbi:unnamed protein product [Ceratitis capitata]|uniref:(Mediterranean fruit fly) hypothetical protein n=1 Tax=Ceratitis capitata TaxID=7213 RepID=A0A811V1W2_CERCA|nr:unnamed protein product [Ceratitis capitata]